jgi:hypothetical protein
MALEGTLPASVSHGLIGKAKTIQHFLENPLKTSGNTFTPNIKKSVYTIIAKSQV